MASEPEDGREKEITHVDKWKKVKRPPIELYQRFFKDGKGK